MLPTLLESKHECKLLGSHNFIVRQVSLIDENIVVSTDEEGVMNVWQNIKENPTVKSYSIHKGSILSISVFKRFIATISKDHYLLLLKIDENNELAIVWKEKIDSPGTCVKISPNGLLIFVSCYNGEIKIYSCQNGKPIEKTPLSNSHNCCIYAISLGKKKSKIASACEDGNITLWNFIQTPEGLRKLESLDYNLSQKLNFISTLTFIQNDNYLVANNDSKILIYNLTTEESVRTIDFHQNMITGIVSGPDDLIAVASRDRTVSIWTLEGKLINLITGFTEEITCIDWKNQLITIGTFDHKVYCCMIPTVQTKEKT